MSAEPHSRSLSVLDRRALLRAAVLAVGGSLVAIPAGEAFALAPEGGANFFTAAERQTVAALADTIIPRTDTPGAIDAGVPATVDGLLGHWASKANRESVRRAVTALDTVARGTGDRPLEAMTPQARLALVTAHDAARIGTDADYAKLKELILIAYYSSEAGATEELRYELVPGSWDPAIPYKPGQPAWAA